jgi:hypothetical protein
MSAQDDKTAGRLLEPRFDGRSDIERPVANLNEAVGAKARPPRPGWKWNGKEWEYSSRYLDDAPVRPA